MSKDRSESWVDILTSEPNTQTLPDRSLLLLLWLKQEAIDALSDDVCSSFVKRVKRSTQNLMKPKKWIRLPDHGGHTVTRTRETPYMTKETFTDFKKIITPLLQAILDRTPMQKTYRYYWDILRREWNKTEEYAKKYGRLPQKNHDNEKTQFSISTIYGLDIRKLDIETYFGIVFPHTPKQAEKQVQRDQEKEDAENKKNQKFKKLSWEDKMKSTGYIATGKEFRNISSKFVPLFIHELEKLDLSKDPTLWREAMDNAMNQWNLDTNNIDKKLVRLKWNRYGVLGRDIWRQYYGIGRWEQVQEIFWLSPTEKVIDLPVEEQVKEIRILPQKTSKPNIEEASHNTILNQPTLSANPLVVAPSLTRTGAKVVQVIGDIVPDRTVLSVDTTDELYLRIGVYFKKAGCKFYFDPKDFEIDPTKKRYKILRNLRERLQKQTENDRDRINEIFDEFWKEYGYTII